MKKLFLLMITLIISATMLTGCLGLMLLDDSDEGYDSDEQTQDGGQDDDMEQMDVFGDDQDDDDGEMEQEEAEEEDSGNTVDLGVAQDGTPFGSFTTTSVYGHEVTDDVFGEYAMTMVNVWATWCPPCIGEMNELEEVYQTLPENVNVLTICDDGGTETDLAIQILSENGCNFDAIITNDEIYNNFLSGITAFPTTVFVDSEGNIFGQKIEGAPGDPVSYYLGVAEEMMDELR